MAPLLRPEPPEGNHSFPQRAHTPIPFLSGESSESVIAPSKPAKPGRRESRLGIRTLFGRSARLHKGEESLRSPSSLNSLNSAKASPRSGGFRASLADMNYWPYGQQVKSELALPVANYPWDSPREMPDDDQDAQSRSPASGAALAAAAAAASASSGKRTPGMSIAKQPRPALAAWTLPTLFRAYQQAHKQQSLAAVSLPIEALMKMGEKTSVEIIAPLAQTDVNTSGGSGAANTSTGDKLRRRNRGDSLSTSHLPWTTKIYILATAGYLLQYTGDGAIDRMPEKVLRLGKTSAAFATDLIPGRHWVLQVSATTEDDKVSTTESRSLLSKLSFRTSEKRYTSNMLMVFDSAEDMDDWMTCLRAMIEQLGGKRSLSEAGLPKEFDSKQETDSKEGSFDGIHLREKKSHGNLIDKEAIRSTQVVPANPSPVLPQDHGRRICDYSIPVIDFDSVTHDMTSDDKSTTNSVVSHDGRQLDNLRDSAHRLSLLSSGQRTILTSTTSSPADSPIRERFPLPADITTIPETAQPRPNGSVIMNRRVSLQTMAPFVGEIGDGMSELGQFPSPPWVSTEPPSPSDPRGVHGFGASSMQQMGRRYVKPTCALDPSGLPPSPTAVGPRVSLRKLSNIRTGRPLSTVEDQPSPKESAMPERPVTSHHAETRSQVPSADAPRVPKLPRGRLASVPNVPRMLGRRLSLVPKESRSRSRSPGPGLFASPGLQADGAQQSCPERLANLDGMRSTFEDDSPVASPVSEKLYYTLPSHIAAAWGDRVKRNRTSAEGDGESTRSFSLGFSWASRHKRASIASAFSEWSVPGEVRPIDTIAETPPHSPPPTGPLPPLPSRPSSSCSNQAHMMGRKKSMPRMAMPPPAPPPTCALPPIPQKQTAQV